MSEWRMKTGRDRYHNDQAFRVLVDMMVAHIYNEDYTPSEMRDAAMAASLLVEERRPMAKTFGGGLASEIERVAKAFPELDNRPPENNGDK